MPGVEATARYEWASEVLDGAVKRPTERQVTVSDKIDRVLTHPLGGTLLFAAMMIVVFSRNFSLRSVAPASEQRVPSRERRWSCL